MPRSFRTSIYLCLVLAYDLAPAGSSADPPTPLKGRNDSPTGRIVAIPFHQISCIHFICIIYNLSSWAKSFAFCSIEPLAPPIIVCTCKFKCK